MNDAVGTQMIGSRSEEGFSPGGILGNARRLRGLSIADVSHALKLAPRQVEAIEADAFDQLRGLTFARGFVRNYARYLGIDPEPLLDAIVADSDSLQVDLSPISNARGDMPTAGSSLGSLLPAGITLVVLIALALAGWYFDWFRVPVPAASVDKIAAVSPPIRDEAVTPVPAKAVEPVQVPAAPPAPAALPEPAVTPPNAAAPEPPAPEPASTATQPPAPGRQRLAFAFEQDSWVEIKDARGRTLHSQLHKAGSADDVDIGGTPPYALVVGNAAQVKLRYKDKSVDLSPFIKISVARFSLQ